MNTFRNILIGLVAMAALPPQAMADGGSAVPSTFSTKAATYSSAAASGDQFNVSITSVTTLTVPSGATGVGICIENAAARYTIDGTTPSLTVGIPLPIGCYTFSINLSQFKFFGAAGATLDASYVK